MSSDPVLIAALVAVCIVAARLLTRRLRLPPTVPLVLLGLVIGALPWVPRVELDPQFVLAVLIPPIIYHHAAHRSAPREARAVLGPITAAGIGLTLVTAAAVAAVARLLLPEVPWGAALALGAAVAPTDGHALVRLGHRPLLRGESLIGEGVALVLFAVALEQMEQGVDVWHATAQLAGAIAGGAALGVAFGWLVVRMRRFAKDPGTLLVLSLATPYAAHFSAEHLGLSAPLATVAAGFYVGARGRDLHTPARATERISWQVLVFLLGGAIAVLLGLELRDLLAPTSGLPLGAVALATAAVLVIALALRWVAGLAICRDMLAGFTLGGSRGAVTLALALAIPAVTGRSALVFVAAAVVLCSGLALLALSPAAEERPVEEERRARQSAVSAAIRRLDQVAGRLGLDRGTIWAQRQVLTLEANCGELRDLRSELAMAQRETLGQLYAEGTIGAGTLHTLTEEIDLRDPHSTTSP
ncbi:cation:proton antiporter [Nonomuraea sp. NPDC050556]|uniref:cation:proton antiporter domain-containing protein n=1 Tax=Nonomuraea sp. NPDC050556 TaxID=3364369 RepID=UPI0037942FF2